jgi:4-oxalomesaconate tautomerase
MSDRSTGVRCMLMRGGTSKGAFFLEDDLPRGTGARDQLLLEIMGSPDPRQIDGVGGAHPLTTKVAIVAPSERDDADLEYLFLQPGVDTATITDRQNCGNMLAAVGPFAVERGLLGPPDGTATVRILMRNTGGVAVARFPVRDGRPVYEGGTSISGVPGTAAEIRLEFVDVAGSSTGSLLPTGHVSDTIEDVEATLIDNGMPVIVIAADDVGVTGGESCAELESNQRLRVVLEEIRLRAGPMMRLGDVSGATIPKMTLVSAPRQGGALCTRTFIPHRCHDAIGVLGAVSVATACLLPGSPAARVAQLETDSSVIALEHPTGRFEAEVSLAFENGTPRVERAGIIRTARKLMDGTVYPRSY